MSIRFGRAMGKICPIFALHHVGYCLKIAIYKRIGAGKNKAVWFLELKSYGWIHDPWAFPLYAKVELQHVPFDVPVLVGSATESALLLD